MRLDIQTSDETNVHIDIDTDELKLLLEHKEWLIANKEKAAEFSMNQIALLRSLFEVLSAEKSSK